MRDDFIDDNPDTSRELVAGVAHAVNFIQSHTPEEIYAVLFPYLEKHGYADYEDAIKANYPARSRRRRAGDQGQRHLALDRLARGSR